MELKCFLILPVCVLFLQSFRTVTSTDVLIIGAGPSGMAAACRLLENGFHNLTILEAESRIGGRIHTNQFGDSVVDMGAHWVHGEKGNVVSDMAKALDMLDNVEVEMTTMIFVSSSELSVNTSTKFLGITTDLVDNDEFLKTYNGSLGGYVTKAFYRNLSANGLSEEELFYADPFLRWFDKMQNTHDGSDSWFYTSGRMTYRVAEGNQGQTWKTGGYSNVFDILTKKVPDPANELPIKDKILFNKEVVNIEWDQVDAKNVKVTCLDGSTFFADHVIVTTSLGVLKERYESLFTPSLPPKKVTAIKGLSIDTVDKIYLRFPHQWWPNDTTGFSFIWTDEDIYNFNKNHNITPGLLDHWLMDVVGFYTVDLNPDLLCGWLTGPSARLMESLPLTDVTADSMELLTHFLGSRFEIPQPIETLRTTWSSNPHFRGSYSFRSMDTEVVGAEPAHLAEPLTNSQGKQTLLFAGEATHDYFYSTVHGAVETGWREADRVLEIIRSAPSKK